MQRSVMYDFNQPTSTATQNYYGQEYEKELRCEATQNLIWFTFIKIKQISSISK